MNTDTKITAQFLATIAWADEEYSTVEKNTIKSIAESMGIPNLPQEMDYYIGQFNHLSGTEVTSCLSEIASQVDANDKEDLLVACVQLMGCDDYLADEEISNFFVIARMLGVSEDRALMLLSQLTTEDETVIDD